MFAARLYRGVPRRVVWWSLAGLVLAGVTTGCNQKDTVARLNPRQMTYLEGVPLPAGFSLVNKMTEDYESGGQRTARHEYRGYAEPQAVRNFYRDQMPGLGWTRVSDQNVKGRINLRFERRSEACVVEIERNWWPQTSVQVIVNPFSRTEMPRQPLP